MNLKEMVISTRNWVDSAQNRDYWRALVNATLNPDFINNIVSLLSYEITYFNQKSCPQL